MPRLAIALATAALLAGCADAADPSARPSPASTPPATTMGTPAAEASDVPSTEPGSPSPPPATDPTPTPTSAPLAWEPAGRPPQEPVTAGGGWSVAVDEERSLATLSGPKHLSVSGDKRFRVGEVLVDGAWAVVVLGDGLRQQAARATVVDLTTGDTTRLDGKSDPPTVTGGTWALHGGLLVHATRGRGGAYCLAARDLGTRGPQARGATVYCAPERHGFTHARITSAEVALMSFDDKRPSCRTLGIIGDGTLQPLDSVEQCRGWELVVTDTGPVWSVIDRENALDEAHVYATAADGSQLDLGQATAGSLTWCAGATYFVRDPQTPGDPARLLRWTDAGAFEVVYETPPGGPAFLGGPRCGGDRITVSAFAESGDEQVSAPLP